MWAAIIIAVTLLGRWAFSVDTYAQEGGGPTPTVTPTSLLGEEGEGEKEKREDLPDCEDPGYVGHPSCSGYVSIVDRTATAEAIQSATATPRPTSTPIPTSTPRPTKTPTPVTGPPIPFIPTEVPCPPGWTRGPCYAPGGTWTPTPKPTATNTPTGGATATPTYTPTPTEEDDDDGGGGTRPTKTPTPAGPTPTGTRSPTPTPTPGGNTGGGALFTATVKVNGTTLRGSTPRWPVFDTKTVTVEVKPTGSATVSNYQFKLVFRESETGFVRYWSGTHPCQPNNWGESETGWSLSAGFTADLIRCGLGTASNTGFEVRGILRGNTGNGFLIAESGNISRAAHREFGRVTYKLHLAISGNRSAYLPIDYVYDATTTDMIRNQVHSSAADWDSETGANIFSPGDSSSDVHVRVFWDGSAGCRNPRAIGCVSPGFDDGSYPHLGKHNYYIRVPPIRPSLVGASRTYWTVNNSEVGFDPRTRIRRYSLTYNSTHELGHTAGLRHLPSGGVMKPGGSRTSASPKLPTDIDVEGMKQVIQSHSH